MDVRDSARTTDDATGIVHCTGHGEGCAAESMPLFELRLRLPEPLVESLEVRWRLERAFILNRSIFLHDSVLHAAATDVKS